MSFMNTSRLGMLGGSFDLSKEMDWADTLRVFDVLDPLLDGATVYEERLELFDVQRFGATLAGDSAQ